ncbi:MAG: septum formation initiator family protein [Alphaproteobacteria bacterium]|nr:septum formation initiator family protein [Alphaproteobacteria bacterium]
MYFRLSHNWFLPLICLLITAYFVFHTVQGNHGVRRMIQVREEIATADKIKQETVAEKERLQAKVNALSPKSLDLDQLEESALRILNMGDENSKIIFR